MAESSPAPHPPHRTLIVGCGKLGTRLGQRLVADGGEVFALRRTTAGLPADFTALAVDLREPVRDALPAVDAMVITLPPSGQGDDDGYLAALRNLASAVPQVPPRVVLVSSTRVFEGYTDGRTLTEQDAPAPASPRATTLLEGERLAVESFNAHILRPAGIYGPGREMRLRKVLEGAPVQYARRTNRIHETDLVRTLHALLTAVQPPRLLHAVDQAPASLGEVVTFIAEELGVQPPPPLQLEEVTGTVLDGTRLLEFLGTLEHPTFQSGYGDLMASQD